MEVSPPDQLKEEKDPSQVPPDQLKEENEMNEQCVIPDPTDYTQMDDDGNFIANDGDMVAAAEADMIPDTSDYISFYGYNKVINYGDVEAPLTQDQDLPPLTQN